MKILLKRAVPVLALLLVSAPALASWTPLGPFGGTVTALAVDPGNPQVVYAGTFGRGLFKSLDAGETWTNQGPSAGDGFVTSLAIDPARPATLYAGTLLGVYKSTDGGASWLPSLPLTFPDEFGALAIDPRTPSTLFAGNRSGIYKSTDGGKTWVLKNTGLRLSEPSVNALMVDPTQPGLVYAGIGIDGLYRSLDGGETWTLAREGIVSALAASAQTDTIYAGTYKGVFKSKDHGESWRSTGRLPKQSVTALIIDPQSASTLFAAVFGFGVFRSTDGGASWAPANRGLTNSTVLALATGGSALYAGTEGQQRLGGVFKSTDRGQTWHFSDKGLTNVAVTTVAVADPLALWAGSLNLGLFQSGDGGNSWSLVPLAKRLLFLYTVVADPAHPGTVYASAGISGREGRALFKTTDSGRTWSRLKIPMVPGLELDLRTNTLLAFGFGLYRSTDGGQSWNPALGPFGGVFLQDVAFDPSSPVAYAAGGFSASRLDPTQSRVFKSVDGGLTWVRSDVGLEPLGAVSRIVVLPSSPSTLFAIQGGTVYRSGNAGASWEKIFEAPGGAFISDLIVGPDDVLYAASPQEGVFSSRDGRSWSPVGDGAPGFVTVLALAPGREGTLYAGTANHGLLVLSQP
jgi:photosystem II stability/assembly factor-like uncharacterized protein